MPHDRTDPGCFGVRAEDESTHPADATEPSWNESIFHDFVSGETCAGHLRIGRFEGQGRAWIWAFFYVGGEWLVVEEPRVPLDRLHGFDVDAEGLRFRREVTVPLADSRIEFEGIARVVSGARAGKLLGVRCWLRYEARGPAHSLGPSTMVGHDGGTLGASRFEQPAKVTGVVSVAGTEHRVDGHGERDHSWGPRNWNMEWTFLVIQAEAYRFQCARVVFDEDTYLSMGYLGEERTVGVVDFEPALTATDAPTGPFVGSLRFETEDGREVHGRLESIAACEIDASHAFDPPTASHYVRQVVRFVPESGVAEPGLGWLEINRFPSGIPGVTT